MAETGGRQRAGGEGLDLHLGVDRAAGFVGRALETALREAIRSGRLHPGSRLPGSRSLAADLGVSRGTVVQAYAQLIAEGWLTGAAGSGTRVAELPVGGTRPVLGSGPAAGGFADPTPAPAPGASRVRRVVAQSIAWVYEAGDAPATEGVPLDLGAYGSRLRTVQGVVALETAVREAPEWVVLRYGLLYGPGTWYARDGLMAERAACGELAADGDVSSFVHVDDAAGAAAAALEWPTGAVNVCDDVPAAGREWVPAFCRAVGGPDPAASPVTERHGWARGASSEYARKVLNWTPAYPSWREGFAAL